MIVAVIFVVVFVINFATAAAAVAAVEFNLSCASDTNVIRSICAVCECRNEINLQFSHNSAITIVYTILQCVFVSTFLFRNNCRYSIHVAKFKVLNDRKIESKTTRKIQIEIVHHW